MLCAIYDVGPTVKYANLIPTIDGQCLLLRREFTPLENIGNNWPPLGGNDRGD